MTTRFEALARPSRKPGVIGTVREIVRRYVERKRTLASLEDLDERMLRDIGLSRTDIEAFRHRR